MRPLHTLRGTMLAVALAGGAAYGTASAPGGSGAGIVPPASTLAQFGAGGHVFGFGPREMYVTDAGYALRVEFSGARAVAPQTDRPAAGGARRGLPPLARVTYPDLWSGITLTYEAVPDGLARSTYRLEAGANPAATVSVQAQLHASTGTCYETTFAPAQVIENDATRFKAGF